MKNEHSRNGSPPTNNKHNVVLVKRGAEMMTGLRELLILSTVLIIFQPTNALKPFFGSKKVHFKLDGPKCGYESCAEIKDDYLNVHLVPHSHDDVGWLKTVDEYFFGANNSIQNANVENIYDSVVEALWEDSRKKFVFVEVAFLYRWWKITSSSSRHRFQRLLNRGQIEIVGGGWCMNDEAAAHYSDIIEQMSLGLRFLNETLGICARPKTIWQIDPFGHSREMANLVQAMGFEGLFLGRIDYGEKDARLQNKSMEMIWQTSDSLLNELFTGVLYNTYSPPPGFCFDVLCGDEQIVEEKWSPLYNLERRLAEFFAYVRKQATFYRTNHILLTMGNDFNYQYAHAWYRNLDKLIKYGNEAGGSRKIRFLYSTPSCYMNAVQKAKKEAWPVKKDDFFPYASDPHAYWTGYFTSRAAFKRIVRQASSLLQVSNQLAALYSTADASSHPRAWHNPLAEWIGVAQHHDAITGTAQQHVNNDYVRGLYAAMTSIAKRDSKTLSQVLNFQAPPHLVQYCLALNTSACPAMEASTRVIVGVYNSLAWTEENAFLRLPVSGDNYAVYDSQGQEMTAVIVPLPWHVTSLPGRQSPARNELVIPLNPIPPLGMDSYFVQRLKSPLRASKKPSPSWKSWQLPTQENIFVDNQFLGLRFSGETGLLSSIVLKHNGVMVDVLESTQEWGYYPTHAGNNSKFEWRASGAYIFRPGSTDMVALGVPNNISVFRSDIVEEVVQDWGWIRQVTRLYRSTPYVEWDWTIGPIPIWDEFGKDVVMRFKILSQDRINAGEFCSDSNGRQTLCRQRDYRESFTLNVTEPVSGNYVPVNSFIYMDGTTKERSTPFRATILVDRAQGGSSIQDDSLELMAHRRLLNDDAFGVGEALNETEFGEGLVVRGQYRLLISTTGSDVLRINESKLRRQTAIRMARPPLPFFLPTIMDENQWNTTYITKVAGLTGNLADCVHILSLEPWGDGRLLIRLENIFEKQDSGVPCTGIVNLETLFANLRVYGVEELTLGADRYRTSENGRKSKQGLIVYLAPMEIKTLLLTVTRV